MGECQRRRRRWLIGYVILLLGTLPIALPCWNGFLKGSIGRFVTLGQIHLVEYAGLGGFGALYARADAQPWRSLGNFVGLLAVVGLVDECIQWILPKRYFDWADVGLNLVGGVMGLAFVAVIDWMIHRMRRA